ncbi:tape measure protein [Luteimonas sp. M1R5S18]|uniref:Tape measure protein n=1 Tax=Luteimonas rhizosphaericola TaxID=3042024 RepID=A0ABT6JNB8_9GAMM|nr:tape measure protein [Luteimonas rhizosphaericola]MDH5832173.1 tape measure protein [Luteimonas rhizosphaericola]
MADIKQGLGLLRGELASVKKQAAQVAPGTSRWQEGLRSVRQQLLGIVSLYGAMRAAGGYVRLADEAANLAGQLRLATKSQAEFNKAQQQTFRIAQETSAEWGAVVALYSRLSQTTDLAQDDILALTKTISQSFAVSSASTVDTENGIRQLSQAIAGGVLRAEEFNTIVDTNGRLVRALGDELGIHSGQVRQYVNDGKVSAEILLRALRNSAEQIDDEFGSLPLTVSRSVTQLRNALTKLVGDTDTAEGASRDLAEAISELATWLSSDEAKQGFADMISSLVEIARLTVNVAGGIGRIAREARQLFSDAEDFLGRNVSQTGLFARATGGDPKDVFGIGAYLKQRFPALYKEFGAQAPARPDFGNVLTGADSQGGGGGSGGGGGGEAGKAVARSNALMRDSVTRALAELDRLYKGSEIGFREYFASRQQLQEQAIDLEIEQARNELAVTKDLGKRRDLEEQIAILLRDRAEIGATAAREQKEAEEALTKQLGDVKLALLELDGNTGRVARAKLEEEYRELFKRLEADSDAAGQAMVRNLIERLVAKAKSDEINDAVARVTSGLSAQEGSISAQVQAGALGYIEGERRLGDLRREALEQLRDLRQAQLAYLGTLSPDTAEYAAAIQALAGIDIELSNIRASMDTLGQGIADSGANALDGFWANLREGSLTGLEMVKQLIGDFARGVYDVVTQDFTKSIVGGIRSMVGRLANRGAEASAEATSAATAATIQTTAATTAAATITAGATTAGATLTAAGTATGAALISSATTAAAIMRTASAFGSFGAAHGGGMVGALQMQRHNINPIVFGNAPHYHGGGQAGLTGLRNKEVAAVLEEGETIRTKQQEAALAARMDSARESSRTVVKTPVVAIGDRAVANALAGADGEDVILTHVRNNWDALVRNGTP